MSDDAPYYLKSPEPEYGYPCERCGTVRVEPRKVGDHSRCVACDVEIELEEIVKRVGNVLRILLTRPK